MVFKTNCARLKIIIEKKSKITWVNPVMDKRGIIRVMCRLIGLKKNRFNNQSIILASEYPATQLLLRDYHRHFYLASNDTVVNEFRQKFFFVGLRKALYFRRAPDT